MRHVETTREAGTFSIVWTASGNDFDGTPAIDENRAKVFFDYDPDDYGNGYYMTIKGKKEPFGCSVYDIRYDRDFNPNDMEGYISRTIRQRYAKGGWDGSWKLQDISIQAE